MKKWVSKICKALEVDKHCSTLYINYKKWKDFLECLHITPCECTVWWYLRVGIHAALILSRDSFVQAVPITNSIIDAAFPTYHKNSLYCIYNIYYVCILDTKSLN